MTGTGYSKGKRILALTMAVMIGIAMMFQFGAEKTYAASPYLNIRVLHMQPGQTYKLKLVHAKKVKWKTSNKKVAVVKKGKVKAVKAGTATITAKKGKKNYKCKVTVANGKKKALIIYFSATGNTKKAAQKLKKVTNADIVTLIPQKKYTKSDLTYSKECRANSEQDKNTYVKIATKVKDLRRYDTIYLGYPIWWGKEPGVVRTFLKGNNLKGKTVMPFCTSGGSGVSGSMKHIRELAKGAKVKDGIDLTDATAADMKAWIANSK